MSKPRRNKPQPPFDDVVFGIKNAQSRPVFIRTRCHCSFVALDSPHVRLPCDLLCRTKSSSSFATSSLLLLDNGVWLATTEEHHRACGCRRTSPTCDPSTGVWSEWIGQEGDRLAGSPVDAQDFEQSALQACDLVLHAILESARSRAPSESRRLPPRRRDHLS